MQNKIIVSFLLAACLPLAAFHIASAQEYAALKGVTSVKTAFDVRTGNPKFAAMQLKLIRQTHKDLNAEKLTPVTTVVFIGPSVKLVSKNREGFTADEMKLLDEIAETIAGLSKDGIGLELCLVAARVNNVDPSSVLPEITRVGNGYISLIGFQAQGYSLIPVY